jgi:hypothetical protein
MRGGFVTWLLLAGCGGASADVGDRHTDSGTDAARFSDSAADVYAFEAGALDAGCPGCADANAADAGTDADAAAPLDASTDATPDAVAGNDASADAADAGTPVAGGQCSLSSTTACIDYGYYLCQSGVWTWDTGNQSCCHTQGRFTIVSAYVAVDTTTGLSWARSAWQGSLPNPQQTCAALPDDGNAGGSGTGGTWRTPTTSELSGLVIGEAVNGVSVCNPSIDQTVFANTPAGGVAYGSGMTDAGAAQCVDFATGSVVAGSWDVVLCVHG